MPRKSPDALARDEARDEALVALGLKEVVWQQHWSCSKCLAVTTTIKPILLDATSCWRCGKLMPRNTFTIKHYVPKKP